MQLLYGNNGIDYAVLAQTSDVNNRIVNELENRRFLSYDFTQQEYSKGKEPEELSFVTTTLNGALDKESIVLTQSKRMNTFQTPCYMSHVQILKTKEELHSFTNAEMRAFMKMEFIADRDAGAYGRGEFFLEDFHGRTQEQWEDSEYNSGIPDAAREAILSLLAGCDDNLRKVTVIVDAKGDSYNERVKEIILDLYTHMPYGWRKRFGFCSFVTSNLQSPEGVKLQFAEQGSRTSGFQNLVDLNNMEDSYYEILLDGCPLEYREYIHAFLDKTEEERVRIFQDLARVFGNEGGVKEYCEWKRSVNEWENLTDQVKELEDKDRKKYFQILINSWIAF